MDAYRSCRVLVIDDNPDDVEYCSRLLAKISFASYSVSSSRTGAAGLTAIERDAPDCVILDYSMPGVDGIEVLERIRRTHPGLPVVMWSSRDENELIRQSIDAGAQNYLVKAAVNADRLHAAINDAVKRPNGHDAENAAAKGETLVLIIDDSPEDAERCVRALKRAHGASYKCIEASGGAEGLQIAEEARPNCILLDYSMPGQDGLEILNQLRSREPFVPVIFMTGQGNETVATRAIKGGAYDYLTKSSLTTEMLHDRIQAAIDDTGPEDDLSAEAREDSAPAGKSR